MPPHKSLFANKINGEPDLSLHCPSGKIIVRNSQDTTNILLKETFEAEKQRIDQVVVMMERVYAYLLMHTLERGLTKEELEAHLRGVSKPTVDFLSSAGILFTK